MYEDEILNRGLEELDIPCSDTAREQLHLYYDRMVETNRVMNLTAITEYGDVVIKHWLDSLCLVKVLSEKQKKAPLHVIDIGTGAGFPGIPLAIFFPHWSVTLMDALAKRVRFLESVTDELGLSGVRCIHGRAEEFGRKEDYREQYDLCVSRAVTRMASLSELCLPFVKVGGLMVAYKAADSEEEIEESGRAIAALGGKLVAKESFLVPQSDNGRRLVCIAKTDKTISRYPRGGGKPMKDPIR